MEKNLELTVVNMGDLELDDTYIADENVEDLLIEIEGFDVQIKLLKEQKECSRKHLIEIIKEQTQKIIDPTGHVLATWNVFYKDKFNLDRFRADYPDLYAAYVEKKSERRWDIKRRKM